MGQATTRRGQFALYFYVWLAFVLGCLVAPFAAWSAPYADYVIDARTGEVLHQTNADTRLHPASLTKMMTLYIAFEAIERGEISLDSKVTISRNAAAEPPSKLGLKAGQTIALRYLIRAAAIKSANDAATAIGEAIEGSESAFAKRMNRTAKALGMSRTTFANANGLTREGHLSTAHDMAILGRHVFYDYPQYYNIFSRRSADAGIAKVNSTNRRFLDAYEGADGIKTGYTSPAGFNLVASAQRGDKRVIAAIFGGKSTAQRNSRMAELLDIGFKKSPTRVAVQKPARPVYTGGGDDLGVDDVAQVVADAVAGSRTVPAGKTLRLNVAVAQSPRPRVRPVPGMPEVAPAEEMLVAMQDNIAAALAEAQAAPAEEETAATATAAPPVAEPAPATEPEEVAPLMVADASAETLAPADPAAEALAPTADAEALVSGIEIASAGTEGASTATSAEALGFVQSTAPQPETLVAAAELAEALKSASAIAPETSPTPAPAPGRAAEPVAVAAAAIAVAAPAAEPAAAAPRPEPKREEIVLAALNRPAEVPEELEVVTRVSTSGGRQWSINVGHFGSRYNAERQLLQTALVEMTTLDDALRKVVARKGGFDANFVGMTEETAALACRRLQARQTECTVVGP